jgi:hypothetical protein
MEGEIEVVEEIEVEEEEVLNKLEIRNYYGYIMKIMDESLFHYNKLSERVFC